MCYLNVCKGRFARIKNILSAGEKKENKMKNIFFVVSGLLIMFCLTPPAWSSVATFPGYGEIDLTADDWKAVWKIDLVDSSAEAEAEWASEKLGATLLEAYKIENPDNNTNWGWSLLDNKGTSSKADDVWGRSLAWGADYFIIKSGNLNLVPDYRHFLFENNANLSFAVIDFSDFRTSDMEFEKISHITAFTVLPSVQTPVPLPPAAFLLGTGLLGLGGLRLRKKRK
jgi:hypothetical protein